MDASDARCVPRWTTAWPTLGDRANAWGAGYGCEEYLGAGGCTAEEECDKDGCW